MTRAVLLVALLAFGGAAAAQPPTAPPPRPVVPATALAGTWVLVEFETNGKTTPAEGITDTRTVDVKAGTYKRRFGAAFVGGCTDTGTLSVAADGAGAFRVELAFERYGGFGERPAQTTQETARETWRLIGRDRLRVADGREVLVYERRAP